MAAEESQEVLFCHSVYKRIHQRIDSGINEVGAGVLIGQNRSDGLYVIGAVALQISVASEFSWAEKHIPAGCGVCGFFLRTDHAAKVPVILAKVTEKLIKITEKLKDKFEGDHFLVVPCEKNEPDCTGYWYNKHDGSIHPANLQLTEESLLNNGVIVRLKAALPLMYECHSNNATLKDNLTFAFRHVKKTVFSSEMFYHIENSGVLFNQDRCIGFDGGTPCNDLYKYVIKDDDDVSSKVRKKRQSNPEENVIHVVLLSSMTDKSAPDCSPIIHHEHREFENVSLSLPVDILGIFEGSQPAVDIIPQLQTAIGHQIDAMRACMLNHYQGYKATPVPYHFKPEGLEHYVTVIYPHGTSEDLLESERKTSHMRFMLAADRPLLRRSNVYRFPEDLRKNAYLVNPHVGLPSSGVRDGTVYLVNGLYSYHHYMQDHFDDNKWGCAYRSLQTVVSWFRWQGYTQALVDVKDKDSKFVGSKKWIGSTEVSYVLDHLLGVTSKILFVSSGAEMSSKARELAHHFQTQGTPVMIGGGVLAHTILGVDYNEVTGDVKFLILDPHYTGAEDLKTVQDKGWCGWKGPEFWDQTAYYNMCMPQRPITI